MAGGRYCQRLYFGKIITCYRKSEKNKNNTISASTIYALKVYNRLFRVLLRCHKPLRLCFTESSSVRKNIITNRVSSLYIIRAKVHKNNGCKTIRQTVGKHLLFSRKTAYLYLQKPNAQQ